MRLDNNPQVELKMSNAMISDQFAQLMYSLSAAAGKVGVSAREASDALQKIVRVFDDDKQEFRYTKDIFEDLADKWNEIGCINPATPEEISQGLLRAETPGATENSNQKEPFDFLEQNAYNEEKPIFDGEDIGWLTPLDSL